MITDKEKLEYIWRIVNEKKLWDKHQLVQIKDILEKRSLTDEQGYQEALELDEEERLVLLKKEEKLEVVLKIIREKGGDSYNYSPSLLLGEIRKILES